MDKDNDRSPAIAKEQNEPKEELFLSWAHPEEKLKEALTGLLANGVADTQALPELKSIEKDKRAAIQEEAARIRWLLAINPNTPAPVLEHLSKDAHLPLLERIAENPKSHITTLIKLSTHENAQVRASLAENKNLSMKTIWRLARDHSPDVRYRLAESYTVPIAVLRVLSEDENPFVVHRAQRTMHRILDEVAALRRD